jgi:hypothetical protein
MRQTGREHHHSILFKCIPIIARVNNEGKNSYGSAVKELLLFTLLRNGQPEVFFKINDNHAFVRLYMINGNIHCIALVCCTRVVVRPQGDKLCFQLTRLLFVEISTPPPEFQAFSQMTSWTEVGSVSRLSEKFGFAKE